MSPEAPVQSILLCSQCGRAFAFSDLVQIAGKWVCAECKPQFLGRVLATGPAGASPLAWRYGGFWIRFAARFVDGLIFGVPFFLLALVMMPSLVRTPGARGPANPQLALFGLLGFVLISFVFGALYEILMLKHRSATLGKTACGLKVIRPDGSPLSWGVCVGRFFMWNVVTAGVPYINSVLMLVSSILLGVDDEKRAIHDRVCDTRVVFK